MSRELDFHFSVPQPPAGPVVELSPVELEKILLKRLKEESARPTEALWQLARFYSHARRHEQALDCLRQVLALLPDPESKANCVLAMGQTMEQVHDYEAAVRYYKVALAFEPIRTPTWYFINNNLGFSLNTLGHFAEGEKYCRKAAEIDPNRPNAHKNLGLALKGQGRYREAARCFVTATQVNAADPRAFLLLQELLKQHPELEYEFQSAANCCYEAVKTGATMAAESKPVVCTGWKRRLILLKTRFRGLARQWGIGKKK